jgi:hypothetical protein
LSLRAGVLYAVAMHLLQRTGTRSRSRSCSALLALGSPAPIGCSDNTDPPVDAAAPDASPAPPDASQPDAGPPDNSTFGFVRINGSNAQLEDDLLVRVVGPAEALYNYRIYVFLDSTGSEDECEC